MAMFRASITGGMVFYVKNYRFRAPRQLTNPTIRKNSATNTATVFKPRSKSHSPIAIKANTRSAKLPAMALDICVVPYNRLDASDGLFLRQPIVYTDGDQSPGEKRAPI